MSKFINHTNTYKTQISIIMMPALHEVPQISKHVFSAAFPVKQRNYSELELFRQQIEMTYDGLHQNPYTLSKSNACFYKLIFYGFAVLFAILGVLVVTTTSTMTYAFLNFTLVFKGFLSMLCGILTITAFVLGFQIRTEREAVIHYYRIAKTRLSKVHTRKQMKMGIKRFLAFFGHKMQESADLQHLYHEACDKISDRREETLHLVDRISATSSLDDQTKEILYNQAIAEFSDTSNLIIRTFRNATLPLRN